MPQVPPTRFLHEILGTLLIGTWFNTTLFAFELTQVCRYLNQHPIFVSRAVRRVGAAANGRRLDQLWIQVLVLSMLVLDSVASVSAWVLTYIVRRRFITRNKP